MFLLPVENTIWILYVWRVERGREECICAGVWTTESPCRHEDTMMQARSSTRSTRVVSFDDLPAGFVPTDQIIFSNKHVMRS